MIEAAETGAVVAGARGMVDGGNLLTVGPVYVDRSAWGRGFAAVLVAALRLDRFAMSPTDCVPITTARLFVRVQNGQPNTQAFNAYLKVGFSEFQVRRLPVPDDDLGRHLARTANRDGTYSTLEMRADGTSLSECRAILRAYRIRESAA